MAIDDAAALLLLLMLLLALAVVVVVVAVAVLLPVGSLVEKFIQYNVDDHFHIRSMVWSSATLLDQLSSRAREQSTYLAGADVVAALYGGCTVRTACCLTLAEIYTL